MLVWVTIESEANDSFDTKDMSFEQFREHCFKPENQVEGMRVIEVKPAQPQNTEERAENSPASPVQQRHAAGAEAKPCLEQCTCMRFREQDGSVGDTSDTCPIHGTASA